MDSINKNRAQEHPEGSGFGNHFGFALNASRYPAPLVYLSVPYGHDAASAEANVAQAEEVAAVLMERGYAVFCPIILYFHIAKRSRNFSFLPIIDFIVISKADGLVALNIEGCFECEHVRREVGLASAIDLPINLVTPGERIAAHLAGELAVEPDVSAELWG